MADLKQRLAPLEGIDMPDRWSEIRHRAPRAGFDPEPPRHQPIAAAALAVVLTVVTVGWLATAFRSGDDGAVSVPGWVTTSWPSVGIRIDHPDGWLAHDVDEPVGHVILVGGALTSRPMELTHPNRGNDTVTTAWDLGAAPTDAVVLSATRIIGGPVEGPDADIVDVPLPDGLEDFREAQLVSGEGATGLRATATMDEVSVVIELWFGSATTQDDRATVDRILSTMRPIPLQVEPEPTPTDSASPRPTLDPRAVDLGLGFGICDADQIAGAFGAGESTRVLWFGTRTNEETLRCSSSSRRFALAVDIGGDRDAEAWIDPIGPNVCFLDCGLVGVVDLDGDGTDELVLLLEGSVTPIFGVVDVGADGDPAVMGYVDGNAPQGVPGDGPAKLTIGGDEAYSYAVSCEVDAGGPLITQRAVAGVVEAPELGARVATYSLRLTPEGFVVVADEVQEGVVPPPSLPLESSLCGLELPPLGMP